MHKKPAYLESGLPQKSTWPRLLFHELSFPSNDDVAVLGFPDEEIVVFDIWHQLAMVISVSIEFLFLTETDREPCFCKRGHSNECFSAARQ